MIGQVSSVFMGVDISTICLYGVVAIGLTALAFRQQKDKIISAWKKEKGKILLWASVCLCITLVTNFLLRFLSALVSGKTEKPLNQQQLESLISPSFWNWTVTGFSLLILAPLLEELVFRWLLFETFGNNYFSVFFSALTFGFAHYHGETSAAGILTFLIYPIMGFAFAYVYKTKKNIIWPIACHFLNNLVAFIFMLFATLK
ncbi:CPBP family intramembrane glutamic endopeptidase [endosymbiont GvMRE of Glomus versiforme]|uniref:CPBP family intramembrane glutamic endopeptidase n=1 Tax=endosymbiont GvMRE of Glomus versiforme TaxID=2039283 RepID=UPI000ECD1041|nr:CPBP family intramembrane glutamic endopeptidase [endosymbiont GvMRE of Glomus versiforme]RHZ37114.1 CAAX amino protease family protein [endosymbiont GvMRE of Glomus versiforme]